MAAENVGDVDIVGRMDDETAILHLAADAQKREESDTRFHDDLFVVLFQKTRPRRGKLAKR